MAAMPLRGLVQNAISKQIKLAAAHKTELQWTELDSIALTNNLALQVTGSAALFTAYRDYNLRAVLAEDSGSGEAATYYRCLLPLAGSVLLKECCIISETAVDEVNLPCKVALS